MARLGAARGALSGKRYLVGVAVIVAIGAAAYLGLSVMMAVPVWTIVAFTLVVSVVWRFWDRIVELESQQTPKLGFFTGENGSLRLNEDVLSSKVVYCIGIRNEGLKTIGNVRVNLDVVEGLPRPIFPERLAIFRTTGDSVDLHPGEAEYFCLMRTIETPSKAEEKLKICCHNDLFSPIVPVQDFVDGRMIALSAYGDGAPRATRRIQVSAKHEAAIWSFDLKLFQNDDQAPSRTEPAPLPRHSNRPERPQVQSDAVRRLLARQTQTSAS